MRAEAVFYIIPDQDRWLIKRRGHSPSERVENRQDAILRARQVASRFDHSRILVLREDGTLQAEYELGSGGSSA